MEFDEFDDALMLREVKMRMAWMEANKFVGEDGKTYYPLPPIPQYVGRQKKKEDENGT